MTLAEKGADDWVPKYVDLFNDKQYSEEYTKINPERIVPVLVHDGAVIRESSIISDYLDDLYADRPLKPESIVDQAHMRDWIKMSDEIGYAGTEVLTFVGAFRPRWLEKSEADLEERWSKQRDLARTERQKSTIALGMDSPYVRIAISGWMKILGKMETVLSERGPWLLGDQFTLADLCLGTFVARLHGIGYLDLLVGDKPSVQTWRDNFMARPSFTEANVGLTGEAGESMRGAGLKTLDAFQEVFESLAADQEW